MCCFYLEQGPREWLLEEAFRRRRPLLKLGKTRPELRGRREAEFLRVLRAVEKSKVFGVSLEASYEEKTQRPLDWSQMRHVDPGEGEGKVPAERRQRKRWQIENIVRLAESVASAGATVVDFCCGLGHQSLPLALLRPDLHFILVDQHAHTLDLAKKRWHTAFPTESSVSFRLGTVRDFDEPFDVGLALHACGPASDDVIDKCLSRGAAFIVCPCCVGKVKGQPKSRALKQLLESTDGFRHLVKAADTNAHASAAPVILDEKRRLCKTLLELDRLAAVRDIDASYHTSLSKMQPLTASPKNDILVGRRK